MKEITEADKQLMQDCRGKAAALFHGLSLDEISSLGFDNYDYAIYLYHQRKQQEGKGGVEGDLLQKVFNQVNLLTVKEQEERVSKAAVLALIKLAIKEQSSTLPAGDNNTDYLEPIQNALYATQSLTRDECETITNGIVQINIRDTIAKNDDGTLNVIKDES